MNSSRLTALATFTGNLVTLSISIIYFYYTDSVALLYSIFISLSGILCSILTFLVIVQKAKGRNSKFSYGTGRLENFNALLIATVMFICVLIAVASNIKAIIYEPHILHHFVNLPITLLVAFVTQSAIYAISLKGLKSDNSPILVILSKDARVGTFRNLISFILIAALWSFSIDHEGFHFWVDKILVFCFAAYGSYIYVYQIFKNFKSLSDFPLNENEQLFILKILSDHFSEFSNIRKIYTTTRGNDFIVEVEMTFGPEMEVGEVTRLQDKMATQFRKRYKTGQFKLNLFDQYK